MKQKICAGGFLMQDNKFLFGKRSMDKSWAPGLWDIVGGHAMKNEDIYGTLKRETLEEIGVEVKSAELLTITDVPDESKFKSFKYYIYMIISWEGEPKNISGEHTEIRWFTRAEFDSIDLALPEYTKFIDVWMKKQ